MPGHEFAEVGVDLTRDQLIIVSSRELTVLHDQSDWDPTTGMGPVQRVVVAARLRAWADHIESPPPPPAPPF